MGLQQTDNLQRSLGEVLQLRQLGRLFLHRMNHKYSTHLPPQAAYRADWRSAVIGSLVNTHRLHVSSFLPPDEFF